MDRIFDRVSLSDLRVNRVPSIPLAPYPGASRTLDRPFKDISGHRHVPTLVNANRVPFLRLKKPQSPFLRRMIRDITDVREHRISRADRLTSEIPIAEDEDEWDEILYENFGLDSEGPAEPRWQLEVKQAFESNHRLQSKAIQKRADVAAKMVDIVKQEKALAQEEKLKRRDKRHKASKARRLARRGLSESEIQEKLYPKTGNAVTYDVSTTSEESPKQGQVEVQQSSKEQEWRKRGDKYRTPEELKQLYEASLRPKTEEEIAEIKEARARRKEEEAERKARKVQRKRENASLAEQRLNKKAEDSIEEEPRADKQEDSDKEAQQVVRRIYESMPRQPETSPPLESQAANALKPDARWRIVMVDETPAPSLVHWRPPSVEDRTKNPQ